MGGFARDVNGCEWVWMGVDGRGWVWEWKHDLDLNGMEMGLNGMGVDGCAQVHASMHCEFLLAGSLARSSMVAPTGPTHWTYSRCGGCWWW